MSKTLKFAVQKHGQEDLLFINNNTPAIDKTKNSNSMKYNNINQFIYKNDIIKLSNYLTDDIIDEINKYLSFQKKLNTVN